MFRYASRQKYKNSILIAVCFVAILSVTISRYYNKTKALPAYVPKTYSGATNEERLAFLKANGVETENEPYYICDVIIPATFDGIYESFESIQNAQGLSLSEYKGKRVRRICYLVKNDTGTSAELFVHNGKIIACALCELTNNGEFHKIID